MTNSQVVRVALAGALAATLPVGGLTAEERDAESAPSASMAAIAGPPPVYGRLVTESADPTWKFEPRYDAVLYLQYGDGAHLTVKHAFFRTVADFPGQNQGEKDKEERRRLTCALQSIKLDIEDQMCPISKFADGSGPIFHDFDHFKFGSQQRLYIFVDNEEVGFNISHPMSFTPFGAADTPRTEVGSEVKHMNQSFLDARYINDIVKGMDALVVNNYFRGRYGQEILSSFDDSEYSANINLLVCKKIDLDGDCNFSNSGDVIALVIDPDTGNGWGYGP